MTQWIFERLAGAAVRRDPSETQLFKTEQTEEGEYAATDALVREVLQNSMDAATGKGPVRIRLALHPADELPAAERLAQYFGRLRSPLRQREISCTLEGVPELDAGFLVCEDFGTRGLGGDPLLSKDPELGSPTRQDFFWFWRNIGRSGKTGDDLGRWGLGKTVYRAASRVGCMLGLTVRDVDGRQLLMGQAVLRIHEHEGREYVPEGYWCGGVNENGLPLPIEAADEVERFRSEWKLSRRPDQPGLSVVVPYVAPELKGARILQAICVHFFLPILRGELIVEVSAPDTGEVYLNAETLGSWAGSIKWDGPKRTKRHVAPPIDFVLQCLAAESRATSTNLLGQTKLPELGAGAFDGPVMAALQGDFAAEKLVAVRVRMALPRRKGPDEVGELFVFLQQQPDGERLDTYYVREGMTITKLNSRAGAKGINAFVLVEKGPLASLLGDSEGPAHEDWDTSEERPDKTWVKWKGRIKFCRRIVDELVELLMPPKTEADFELLSDFFSVERTQGSQRSRPPGGGDDVLTFGGINGKPHWYRVEGRRGGFRIVRNAGEPLPENARLQVSVAYDLPTGNPLRKWSPFDFEFGKDDGPRLRGEKVKVARLAGNVLVLTVEGESFSFGADGFDLHRDVLVRIDELNDIPGTEEGET